MWSLCFVLAAARTAPDDPVAVWTKGLAAAAVLLFLIGYYIKDKIRARRQPREDAERAANLEREAELYFARVKRLGAISPIESSLILGADEQALLSDESRLYETRAVRVGAGAGTSIQGVHVGGGASESHDRVRLIDSGTLVLTTKRLVFDGGRENRTVQLTQILSVEMMADAIEVSTSRRSKSFIFAVPNPIIWSNVLRSTAQAAKGGP
jgi:hypothetical protein